MSPLRCLIPGLLVAVLSLACDGVGDYREPPPATPAPNPVAVPEASVEEPEPEPEPAPPPMRRPVPFWENGRTEHEVDADRADEQGHMVLELGERWTPYLFSEQDGLDETPIPHAYRETYLALARGEFPDDHHGARARRDKYLELYGILPTFALLRERLRAALDGTCAEIDRSALDRFDGFISYQNNRVARRRAAHFRLLERRVSALIDAEGGEVLQSDLDESSLSDRQKRNLREYRRELPRVEAIRAAQARLECEGYFEGKGRFIDGGMDWPTHEALAEFERRHRVYGWGVIGRGTLEHLRGSPDELERQAVVRILTERAMHSLGVIEDGSAPPRGGDLPQTYRGMDGQVHEVPNLEEQLSSLLVESLGMQTPSSTLEFLDTLGDLSAGTERLIGLRRPTLPEYYSEDMELSVQIDRGDVWYEFPYDEEGRERSQPVQRRPRTTIFVNYNDQRIAIARFGTTVGGWRTEQIEGRTMWRYKNSPVGRRIWRQIVSAPVWMPPASTPPRSLLRRVPGGVGHGAYHLNHHETGPSYASAYGLVAAYHLRYTPNEDGTFRVLGDEGIRSHGSVDYMSIMRRHSHGCHRLHNHIAVRLMSFILAHRPHRRLGHARTAFRHNVVYEEQTYELAIDQGGYVFELERPLEVEVLEGRIRGTRQTPIEIALPRYDSEVGAYLQPDGQAVRISRLGEMTPYELPLAEGEVPADGTLPVPTPTDNGDVSAITQQATQH